MSNRGAKNKSDGFAEEGVASILSPAVRETKGSINLRIEAQTRQLIDDAAAALGKTRTEFMIDSARSHAVDVLLDQRLFALDGARYDSFSQALNNPMPPGPRLRSLLQRVPTWRE